MYLLKPGLQTAFKLTYILSQYCRRNIAWNSF